jgi:hypothetical protein
VSDSPVGTVPGRCSSTSSCSGDAGSSSNTGRETAADATHLRHNRQGMHTAGTGAGDRAQQVSKGVHTWLRSRAACHAPHVM